MITRWKILHVSDHFSSIHFTSAHRGEKNNHLIWSLYGAKQETEPQMASPISFSLGVLQGRLATPPKACWQINTRNQAITLLWKRYVHNQYVIIFHLLAVFNTLIIISPHWTERKLFLSQLGFFLSFGFLGLVLIYMIVEECVVEWSLCIFIWVLFGFL